MTKLKMWDFFEYMVILFIILDTNTVYATSLDINFFIPEITIILLVVYLVMRFSKKRMKKMLAGRIAIILAIYYISMILLFIMSVGEKERFTFIARILLIFPMMILYFVDHIEQETLFEPIHKYVNVMTVISIISLFFWIFGSQLHLVSPTGSIRSGWGAQLSGGVSYPSYFGLYFERQRVTFLTYTGLRNQGIFAEGPMFSLCLVLAIAAELFLPRGKMRKDFRFSTGRGKRHTVNLKLLCLIITLITTFTTTGQILLILMLVFRFFMQKSKVQFNNLIKLLIGGILVAVGAYAAISIFLLKATSASWIIRTDEFNAGLRVWLSSPIWGKGFGNMTLVDSFRSETVSQLIKGESGSSNSFMMILAQGGVLLLFIYMFPVYKAIQKALREKNMGMLMMITILMFEFVFTASAYQFGTLFFFAFLYADCMDRDYIVDNRSVRFVWKMPIWLDEEDGRATGIREENVSFGVFGTLIRRSVARPADLFRIMEQNDPSVPEYFAEKRVEAEQAARAKLGARMGLADIYEELLPMYGSRTNDLMALEIQYEIAGCRPVADNIDLVNLCMEHDKNVFLMADTYLPSSVIRRMLDVCGVYHYDRLYVSCEEGACKADGSLFWKVLADQEIRPSELRHIGSDRQGDVVEPWRVGVHVKRGKKKDQSTVDKDLPEDVALYERTLQSCIRNCADDLDSGDARLGCETFGPLLAGFTAWLREQLRRDDIQDVYFLAGDGSVLKQAFDAQEDGGFRTHSLYFPEQTAEQDHEALLAYLRACGMQGRVALVDTGRQAGVQRALENLIAEARLDIQVKGYYVGLNPNADGMQAAGYLYGQGKGKETLEKLSPVMAIFDTVFHAQHGAVRRIAMRDGQPVPELDAYEYASDEGRICDEIAILRAYQAGALTLVREMNTAFPGGVPQLPGEAAVLPLLRMGTNPTLQEAELWGNFRVFRDGKATLMARPRGMGAYLLHPGQLKRDYAASPWKIGFLHRLIRLPLAYEKIAKQHSRKR